jgi:probable rRNA maturation factor
MTIKVDVLIQNTAWKKHISNPSNYLKKKIKKAEEKISILKNNKLNFTLLLSGNSEIKKLNNKFRKKNRITDILSFPFHEKKTLSKLIKKKLNNIYLGDIIINLNEIIKKSKNKSFPIAFDRMWVHGLTHLLGYRHKSNRDFSVMQKLENRIIKNIK